MPTSSFDKDVVITDPEAIDRLVNSLLYDKPRVIDTSYLSEENQKKGLELLRKWYEKWKQENAEE